MRLLGGNLPLSSKHCGKQAIDLYRFFEHRWSWGVRGVGAVYSSGLVIPETVGPVKRCWLSGFVAVLIVCGDVRHRGPACSGVWC